MRRCLALLAVILLAACTTDSPPGPPGTSSSPAGPASPSAPSTSAPSPSPSPSPSASPTGLPRAADGTRLAACKDSKCEVVVSRQKSIELSRSSRLYAIAVYEVKGDEVGLFFSVRGGGSVTFSCENDDRCNVSVRGASGQLPASATVAAHPGADVQVAKVTVKVVAVAGGKAVLRLAVAK